MMRQLMSKSGMLWFGGFFLLFGLALVITSAVKYFEGRQLREWGRTAQGEGIEKRLERASRTGPSSSRNLIRYRFRTEAGLPIGNTVTVDPERFEALPEGGSVNVVYVPQRPLRNHLGVEYFEAQSGIGEGISGTVCTMIGAILIWGPARKWMREPRLPRAVIRPRRFLRTAGNLAIALAAVFIAAVLAEAIPWFKSIDTRISENHSFYLGLALSVMIAGLGVFLGAILFLLFQGKSSGEFQLTELFAAVRSGSAARSPVWRLRLWVTMGAMIMVFGLLSVFSRRGRASCAFWSSGLCSISCAC
jgi:hypothetical protein